jgi:threonine/homoserine/homoserine lactone efflux protein
LGLDWFVALSLFIAIAGLTPGPNNIIAMTIGFNYGYRKVLPHLFGVMVGFPIILLLIGLVLRPIMEQYATVFLVLKYISIIYIIFISYKIASAPVDKEPELDKRDTPITFWQSVAFQWVNPKAWAGAMTTITVYMAPEHYHTGLAIATGMSMISILVAISMWALIGKQIKLFLSHPRQVRIFNITMACLLLVAVGMMVF